MAIVSKNIFSLQKTFSDIVYLCPVQDYYVVGYIDSTDSNKVNFTILNQNFVRLSQNIISLDNTSTNPFLSDFLAPFNKFSTVLNDMTNPDVQEYFKLFTERQLLLQNIFNIVFPAQEFTPGTQIQEKLAIEKDLYYFSFANINANPYLEQFSTKEPASVLESLQNFGRIHSVSDIATGENKILLTLSANLPINNAKTAIKGFTISDYTLTGIFVEEIPTVFDVYDSRIKEHWPVIGGGYFLASPLLDSNYNYTRPIAVIPYVQFSTYRGIRCSLPKIYENDSTARQEGCSLGLTTKLQYGDNANRSLITEKDTYMPTGFQAPLTSTIIDSQNGKLCSYVPHIYDFKFNIKTAESSTSSTTLSFGTLSIITNISANDTLNSSLLSKQSINIPLLAAQQGFPVSASNFISSQTISDITATAYNNKYTTLTYNFRIYKMGGYNSYYIFRQVSPEYSYNIKRTTYKAILKNMNNNNAYYTGYPGMNLQPGVFYINNVYFAFYISKFQILNFIKCLSDISQFEQFSDYIIAMYLSNNSLYAYLSTLFTYKNDGEIYTPKNIIKTQSSGSNITGLGLLGKADLLPADYIDYTPRFNIIKDEKFDSLKSQNKIYINTILGTSFFLRQFDLGLNPKDYQNNPNYLKSFYYKQYFIPCKYGFTFDLHKNGKQLITFDLENSIVYIFKLYQRYESDYNQIFPYYKLYYKGEISDNLMNILKNTVSIGQNYDGYIYFVVYNGKKISEPQVPSNYTISHPIQPSILKIEAFDLYRFIPLQNLDSTINEIEYSPEIYQLQNIKDKIQIIYDPVRNIYKVIISPEFYGALSEIELNTNEIYSYLVNLYHSDKEKSSIIKKKLLGFQIRLAVHNILENSLNNKILNIFIKNGTRKYQENFAIDLRNISPIEIKEDYKIYEINLTSNISYSQTYSNQIDENDFKFNMLSSGDINIEQFRSSLEYAYNNSSNMSNIGPLFEIKKINVLIS